jgi:hypothetical protein
MHLRNRTPTKTNDGETPFEEYHRVKPDVAHIQNFGCPVKVTLPAEHLKMLDDRAAMGYLLGFKYEGAYRVWIPKIGIRETRDNTFYEDGLLAPTMHDEVRAASMGEVQGKVAIAEHPRHFELDPAATTAEGGVVEVERKLRFGPLAVSTHASKRKRRGASRK